MTYSIPKLERMLSALSSRSEVQASKSPSSVLSPELVVSAAEPSYAQSLEAQSAVPSPSMGGDVSQETSVQSSPPEESFKDFVEEGQLRSRPSVPKEAKQVTHNIIERDAEGRISNVITYTLGEQTNGA